MFMRALRKKAVETPPSRLDAAYALAGKEEVRALYADWAADYDAELAEKGYASPARCAAALARFAPVKAAPVLDLGCGTGLSGAALTAEGFTAVDGADFSAEMLEEARAKGVYRDLVQADLAQPIPAEKGDYAHIAAVGVFSPGHAPPELIEAAIGLLPRDGCLVLTLNDHAIAEKSYGWKIRDLTDTGWARLLMRERGPHLPGIGLEAEVWVLQRAWD